MAFLSPTISYHHHINFNNSVWVFPILRNSILSLPCSINHNPTSPLHLHRSFPLKNHRLILRSSLTPPPPPGRETQRFTGVAATFSRLWDTVQIFFAVLFWMSLFFWASAMDRTNSGRGSKRDRFK